MFDIYSIGDSLFLQQVLNALAMITGTGSFMALVKIGFLMGIIFIVLQAIVDAGRSLSFQHALIGWLLFSLFFGATAAVRINDVYTGQVRVVGNVPYGVAATGSIISTVGYRTTELFEQAFSTPTMTSYGFAEALQVLAKTRQAFMDKTELGVVNTPNFGTTDDIVRSWENYIKDCTLVGVDLNLKPFPSIMGTTDPRAALQFNSDIYGTQIFLGGAVSEPTCTEAWVPLNAATDSPAWASGAERILRARLDNTGALFTGAVSPTAATDRVDMAVSQLGLASASARQYILAAVLSPALEEATVGKNLSEQGFTHALMARDAIERRNSEWAAGQSMFFNVMRPALTFIEAFTYAIAPLIAFLFGIGMVGIKAGGKYVLTLIWIQLWMPLLAIINLFISMSATYKMVALSTATNFAVPSFGAMYQLDGVLQTYIAYGGMLSSIVPGIALMLVYGGSWATTGLVDRMSSTSQVDATQATPKALTQGALLAAAPLYSSDAVSGMRYTGAEAAAATISIGSSSQTSTGDKTSIGTNTGITSDEAVKIGQGMKASTSARDQLMFKTANSIGHDLGFDNKQTEALQGILGAEFGGRGGGAGGNQEKGDAEGKQEKGKNKPGFLSAAAKVALSSTFTDAQTNSIMEKLRDAETTETGKGFSAEYSEATSQDTAHGVKTAAEKYTSSDAYRSRSASSTAGMAMSVNSLAFGQWAADPQSGRLSKLTDIANHLGVGAQASNIARDVQPRLGVNGRSAEAIGAMTALANLSSQGGPNAQAAHDAFVGFAEGQSGLRADRDLPLAEAYGLTPDPALKTIDAKELQNKAGDIQATAADLTQNTDIRKIAQQDKAELAGKGLAAQKEMRGKQAGRAFEALANDVGKGPGFAGGGPGQSVAKMGTQEAIGLYKTTSDALKQVTTASGRAFGAGAAATAEKVGGAFNIIEKSYHDGKPLSPTVATALFATALASGVKGGADAIKDLPKEIFQDAQEYAQQHGLKPEQAKLYANEQANIVQRVMNGTNDQVGIMDEDRKNIRGNIENDNKDGVLAKSIEMAARTGSVSYLDRVGYINNKLDNKDSAEPADKSPGKKRTTN